MPRSFVDGAATFTEVSSTRVSASVRSVWTELAFSRERSVRFLTFGVVIPTARGAKRELPGVLMWAGTTLKVRDKKALDINHDPRRARFLGYVEPQP
jgi:hypothetical protein